MAKKRQNYKPAPSVARSAALNESATLVSAQTKPSSSQAFNPDYSDIIKDLKRIGVLAGAFFVVLVALSFFIQ